MRGTCKRVAYMNYVITNELIHFVIPTELQNQNYIQGGLILLFFAQILWNYFNSQTKSSGQCFQSGADKVTCMCLRYDPSMLSSNLLASTRIRYWCEIFQSALGQTQNLNQQNYRQLETPPFQSVLNEILK